MMKAEKKLLILAVSFCLAQGVTHGRESLLDQLSGETVVPREANTIYLVPFKNMTKHSALPDRITSKLSSLIVSDGRLAIHKEMDAADTVLEGKIKNLQTQPLTFNSFGREDKKRLRIVVSVKLTDNRKQRVIFDDPEIQAFIEFSEITPPITSEIQAVENLIDSLSKRIFSKIISGWYTNEMTNIEKGKKQ
ncbi:MAG: LPS assembly lipoprotein LptE [Spirochaetia bacterium]|jgi:hypothetical protein|nr:LPS assembly lipoprotein LptE [Spirochaetia bacterium]